MRVFIPLLIGLSLACGGVGGGSERAVKLCQFLETNKECPCDSFPVGSVPIVQGTKVEVLSVKIVHVDPKDSANWDERDRLKKEGGNVLAVELALTNDTPMKIGIEPYFYLHTTDGERRGIEPGSSAKQLKEGYLDRWKNPSIGPGQTKKTVAAFVVPKGEEKGAILEISKTERKPDPKDPRGRKKLFTVEQVLLDLPDPE